MTGSGTRLALALFKMVTWAPFLVMHSFLVNMEEELNKKKIQISLWVQFHVSAVKGVRCSHWSSCLKRVQKAPVTTSSTLGMESSLVPSLLFQSMRDPFCIVSTMLITYGNFCFSAQVTDPHRKRPHTAVFSSESSASYGRLKQEVPAQWILSFSFASIHGTHTAPHT